MAKSRSRSRWGPLGPSHWKLGPEASVLGAGRVTFGAWLAILSAYSYPYLDGEAPATLPGASYPTSGPGGSPPRVFEVSSLRGPPEGNVCADAAGEHRQGLRLPKGGRPRRGGASIIAARGVGSNEAVQKRDPLSDRLRARWLPRSSSRLLAGEGIPGSPSHHISANFLDLAPTY